MVDSDLAIRKETIPITPTGRGHEEPMAQGDIEIPRAKLVQPTSDEATLKNSEERVELGKIINSITKEVLPELFIPVFRYVNWIRWNPRNKKDQNFDPAFDPGALIFETKNANDPRVLEGEKFGPNGEPPAVTKYLNFFSYFPGHSMPVVVSFAKTSFAAGQRLNSLTLFNGGDMFSMQYKLRSVEREAEGTKFFVYDVAPGGKPSKKDFDMAENFWSTFRGKTIKAHQDSPEN
ncbi:MAG: hypothetical protein [Siphoviridae sp. ctCJE6]|nr:MAG: hypothetical protein [Siphoviridae sp. ctCJE6]